jgi:hypothetical protein
MKTLEETKAACLKEVLELKIDIDILSRRVDEFVLNIDKAASIEELKDVVYKTDFEAGLKHITLF